MVSCVFAGKLNRVMVTTYNGEDTAKSLLANGGAVLLESVLAGRSLGGYSQRSR